jgi:hypothetical protein
MIGMMLGKCNKRGGRISPEADVASTHPSFAKASAGELGRRYNTVEKIPV